MSFNEIPATSGGYFAESPEKRDRGDGSSRNPQEPILSPHAPMPNIPPPPLPHTTTPDKNFDRERHNPETSLPHLVPSPDGGFVDQKALAHASPSKTQHVLNPDFSENTKKRPSYPDGEGSCMTAEVASMQQPIPTNHYYFQNSNNMHSNHYQPNPYASYQNPPLHTPHNEQQQAHLEDPYQYAYRQNGDEGGSAFKIHYEDEADAKQQRKALLNSTKGDASLRPNTGLTNSYEFALWGMAPHELLGFLSKLDIVASASCLMIASLSWIGKLVFLQLDKVVLLAYLAALSFCLGFIEVTAIVTPEQQRLIPGNFYGRIRDQLGFLFHPLGRAFFVILLTTMCWGIGGIFLGIAGLMYFISGIGWVYASCAYSADLPRLMGSMDEAFRAEALRRNVSVSAFSVATWQAFMSNPVESVRTSWTTLMNSSRAYDFGADDGLNPSVEDNGEATDERTSLIH